MTIEQLILTFENRYPGHTVVSVDTHDAYCLAGYVRSLEQKNAKYSEEIRELAEVLAVHKRDIDILSATIQARSNENERKE